MASLRRNLLIDAPPGAVALTTVGAPDRLTQAAGDLRQGAPSDRSQARLRTTCLISNYNYGRFVEEAVDSALAQTIPVDEIIVVDDGSTDDSLRRLQARYRGHPVVQILSKANQGQLSCFNEGFLHSTGDIVFFLDADDLFEPNHVEEMLRIYQAHPHSDFVFCGCRLFGKQEEVQLWNETSQDLGCSVVHSLFCLNWVGAPTSCLSLRRRALDNILPLPLLDDWRVRADDCLIFGASIAGASKYHLAQPLTRYRIHDSNNYHERQVALRNVEDYRRKLAINRLVAFVLKRTGYNPVELGELWYEEFLTIERPTFKQLRQYASIGLKSRKSWSRKCRLIAKLARHYWRSKRSAVA